MSSKYTQQEILDITKTFIQGNSDADFIQKKMYEGFEYPRPSRLFIFNKRQNSDHGVVDTAALEELGQIILKNNLHASINAYNLTLPSVNEMGGYHAVALMTDTKANTIWYQDSYGIEMRKELKDFFKQLFPKYKITCFNQIQQDKQRNDRSCYLLAEYNILDMWHRKTNHTQLLKEYDSTEARKAVWNIVKLIENDTSAKGSYIPKAKQDEVLSKKYLLECKKNGYRDFKYRLTQEKNYPKLIKQAAQKTLALHNMYLKLLEQNFFSK